MTFESELEQVQKELGISGELEDLAGIGYLESAEGVRSAGRTKIAVPAPGDKGEGVVWPLPANAFLTLAAAAAGNLIFTPNRNVSIIDLQLDIFSLVATVSAQHAACHVTNITVQGRPQLAGVGVIPLTVFKPLNPHRVKMRMENCQSGQNIIVTLINNDAATVFNITGCVWCVCVK
jgi:hypothetical protein